MPQRILLTGANGFVGSYLRIALREHYPDADIYCIGMRSTGADHVGEIIDVDLTDAAATADVVRRSEPTIVIHLAAQSSAVDSDATAVLTWTTNLGGSLNLALAIALYAPTAVVLFVSTTEVYGGSFLLGAVTESSPLVPLNVYAKSKALTERMFSDVLPSSTRLIIVRPFNHTGPGQREHFVLPSFAAQIARIEAGLQEPEVKVGNLDVQRDFLDVRDVVSAYLHLIDRAHVLPSPFIVIIASGRLCLLGDLLRSLQRLASVEFQIAVEPARLRPVDLPCAAACPDLLRAVTGWGPRISITQTLSDLLDDARVRISNS